MLYFRDHPTPLKGRDTSQPPLDSKDLYRPNVRVAVQSARGPSYSVPLSSRIARPATAHGYRPLADRRKVEKGHYAQSPRPSTARPVNTWRGTANHPVRPLTAGNSNSYSTAGLVHYTDPPVFRTPKMEILCSENGNSVVKNRNFETKKRNSANFALRNCSK